MFNIDITSGKHILTGVSHYRGKFDWRDDANGVCFILDGKHYFAIEDPDDGYRSYLDICASNNKICKNVFPPQEVDVQIFEYKDRDWGDENTDAFHIVNPKDGSIILKLEEEHYDVYYPCAVWEYHPENLPINKQEYCL